MKKCKTPEIQMNSYKLAPRRRLGFGISKYTLCLSVSNFCSQVSQIEETGWVIKMGFHQSLKNIFPTVHDYHNLLIIQQISLYSYAQWTPQGNHFNII